MIEVYSICCSSSTLQTGATPSPSFCWVYYRILFRHFLIVCVVVGLNRQSCVLLWPSSSFWLSLNRLLWRFMFSVYSKRFYQPLRRSRNCFSSLDHQVDMAGCASAPQPGQPHWQPFTATLYWTKSRSLQGSYSPTSCAHSFLIKMTQAPVKQHPQLPAHWPATTSCIAGLRRHVHTSSAASQPSTGRSSS